MKKYGVKFREIYNRETKKWRKVYSPVIYDCKGVEVFISKGEEIMEFNNREDALAQAEQSYNKLKERNADWIRK